MTEQDDFCRNCDRGRYVSSMNGAKVMVMVGLGFLVIVTGFVALIPALGAGVFLNRMMPTYIYKCDRCGHRR